MELNLNDELMAAQKECEDSYASWQQAQGKLNYLISIIQKQTPQTIESEEAKNDLKN